MSDIPATRTRFLEALSAIVTSDRSTRDLTDTLRAALLDYASETPDNLDAAGRIEVGSVGATAGLKLAGKSVLLSDVAHALEDRPLPEALKQSLPAMSEKDWEAFTRMTTLLYTLLSPQISDDP